MAKSSKRSLEGYIGAAWAVHSLLASRYVKRFRSTKQLEFRLTHALEIFTTVTVAVWLYRRNSEEPESSPFEALVETAGTLVTLDSMSFVLSRKLRKSFDPLHIVVAYAAVFGGVLAGMLPQTSKQ